MTCQVCGCDDAHGCRPACYWVWDSMCSACVLKALAEAGMRLGMNARLEIAQQLLELADVLAPEASADPSMAYEDPAPRLWRPGDPL